MKVLTKQEISTAINNLKMIEGNYRMLIEFFEKSELNGFKLDYAEELEYHSRVKRLLTKLYITEYENETHRF
jgi:hypothetical protein